MTTVGELLTLLGASLVLLAGLGLLRFSEPLARLHALTKASTIGVVLVFTGAAVQLDNANDWTTLLLASVMQMSTSPISAILIARSTYLVRQDRIPFISSYTPDDTPRPRPQ